MKWADLEKIGKLRWNPPWDPQDSAQVQLIIKTATDEMMRFWFAKMIGMDPFRVFIDGATEKGWAQLPAKRLPAGVWLLEGVERDSSETMNVQFRAEGTLYRPWRPANS